MAGSDRFRRTALGRCRVRLRADFDRWQPSILAERDHRGAPRTRFGTKSIAGSDRDGNGSAVPLSPCRSARTPSTASIAPRPMRIETSKPGGPVHSTIVWAVVVDGPDVFVRSWRGPGARWYREARANPDVAVQVRKERLPALGRRRHGPRLGRSSLRGSRAQVRRRPGGHVDGPRRVLDTTLRIEGA